VGGVAVAGADNGDARRDRPAGTGVWPLRARGEERGNRTCTGSWLPWKNPWILCALRTSSGLRSGLKNFRLTMVPLRKRGPGGMRAFEGAL